MNAYRPKTRRTQVLSQELTDEVLVYDVERHEAHCLNPIAARVWTLCDGEKTVPELARLVAPELDPEAAENLVWCALDQFAERHLLEEPVDGSPAPTRRQMVLSLGLMVGLALPVVESIMSPPAAFAQSGGVTGGSTGATP
jgi:hypothetical protein